MKRRDVARCSALTEEDSEKTRKLVRIRKENASRIGIGKLLQPSAIIKRKSGNLDDGRRQS